jgi:hypothetical protein
MSESSTAQPLPQILSPAEHGAWDCFVAACPEGTLFHTAWWHRAWGCEPHILVRKDPAGRLVSGLAAHVERWLWVRALRRPPLTPVNHPLALAPPGGAAAARSAVRRETDALLAALPILGLYDIAFHTCDIDPMPFIQKGFGWEMGLSYVIPHGPEAAWRSRMTPNRRADLRRAHKEAQAAQITVRCDLPMAAVVPVLRDASRTKGYDLGAYAHRMTAWWDQVLQHQAGRTYGLVTPEGEVLGVTILVWDARKAYYLGGGLSRQVRASSLYNNLLMERMLQDGMDIGLDFDFEGSSLPGVEWFFRQWGGELHLTHRALKLRSLGAFVIWQANWWLKSHRKAW